MSDFIGLLEWPAMIVTLIASWFLASKSPHKRIVAFALLISGNVLWIAWGWDDGAWALVGLNAGLLALNVRGIVKNEDA
jgi:hypothetical protein